MGVDSTAQQEPEVKTTVVNEHVSAPQQYAAMPRQPMGMELQQQQSLQPSWKLQQWQLQQQQQQQLQQQRYIQQQSMQMTSQVPEADQSAQYYSFAPTSSQPDGNLMREREQAQRTYDQCPIA